MVDLAGRSERGKHTDNRESTRISLPKRRPLPKPVRAAKLSPVAGTRPTAEPTNTLVLPPSDPPFSPTRESSLQSSNKENHGSCKACPLSHTPSPTSQGFKTHGGAPPALEQYRDTRPSTSRRAPLSLPNEDMLYSISPRSRASRGVLLEWKDTSKAPWESSEDDEPADVGARRDDGPSPTASQTRAEDGHSSGGEGDVDNGSDGRLDRGVRDTDALESAVDVRSDRGEDDVGSVYETESSAEQDFLDDEGPSRLVEQSVDAAVKKPWTHDFDNVEAWYCTVFLWIVVSTRSSRHWPI